MVCPLPSHCEVRESQLAFPLAKRRGNPESRTREKIWIASSQGLLAMTGKGRGTLATTACMGPESVARLRSLARDDRGYEPRTTVFR